MKRIPMFLLCGLAAFLLSGCFDVETLVKVKPDGTGTIEQTVLVSKEMVTQMKDMQAQFGAAAGAGGNAKDEPFNLLNESDLKKQAATMGEGVTFESAQKLSTQTGEGFKAIFAFKDINKLKLDQSPSSAAPKMGPMTPQAGKQELVSFQMKPGKPAELTVTMPPHKLDADAKSEKDKGAKDAAPNDEKPDPGMLNMMKDMLKGMRMAIAVEVEGAIASTDASYRDGAKVTLMEIDFGKLTADPKVLESLATKKPASVEDAKQLLKSVPGIKVETNPKVSIKFQ